MPYLAQLNYRKYLKQNDILILAQSHDCWRYAEPRHTESVHMTMDTLVFDATCVHSHRVFSCRGSPSEFVPWCIHM